MREIIQTSDAAKTYWNLLYSKKNLACNFPDLLAITHINKKYVAKIRWVTMVVLHVTSEVMSPVASAVHVCVIPVVVVSQTVLHRLSHVFCSSEIW